MTRLSNLDFGYSNGQVAKGTEKSWVAKLVDFLLGPSSTPHPIYTIGIAAGFGDDARLAERPRKPKPIQVYKEDAASEAIYCGLAGAGLASYGFVAHSQEHENGRG